MSSIDLAVARGAHTARRERAAAATLHATAAAWTCVAVFGQLLFAAYVAGFYGRAALAGDYAAWNRVLPHGYVAGDAAGNTVVALHLAFAVAILVGGALQLVPVIRRRWPRAHRWNGRVYLTSAAIMSVGGLVMVWTRGAVGDVSQHVAISVNALLILGCGAMAWRHAVARRIDAHRRWALRLYLVVGGVWFFRISLMLWIVANQGPAGFDPKTFTGPALTILAFAQYAVPLTVLELYLRAQRCGSAASRYAVAALVGAATLATVAGVGAAAVVLWLPRL
ncbi:DUF2306 domain-containing protein [Tahibacter soli]|uniref:DUF2306 domain-containing protein n=1 Tax=Tahibacter soli TaxID=2983605 RepID=A0A9X3YK74_9GAMM|nr:DUF2306 domain-containing protein [Tahibacter soli]MDC8012725.1 DUF2306 domain-containing protein [Tahibacter soli]